MKTPEQLPLVPGLDRGDVRYYEEAELGWSVPYSTPQLTATVYVYPHTPQEAEDLSNDLDSNLSGLAAFVATRGYEFVPLDTSPGRVDATRLDTSTRHASFLLRGNEESGTASNFNEIILAIVDDQCLKIRCTYTPEKPKRTGVAINNLLAALRSVFWPE